MGRINSFSKFRERKREIVRFIISRSKVNVVTVMM